MTPRSTRIYPPVDPELASERKHQDETDGAQDTGAEHTPPRFGPPAAADEVGVLGPYRIVREVGRGGMGVVYAATDTRLGRQLALKVVLPAYRADRPTRERFLREARAAARVSHDNVVTVFEADERDGITYIAMQFLRGEPLNRYLGRVGNPPVPHVLRIAGETAAGLAAAHHLGLVHRDIKPSNLWLEAPHGRVKILDFGAATPPEGDVELTQSGVLIGTPAYMSPEQARGGRVDPRSDLFSLGGVLYRLCTGRLPFLGSNTYAVLSAIGRDDPSPVSDLNPDVPEPLADLIHQLLAKDPADRPQTADEVAARVAAIQRELDADPSHIAERTSPTLVAVAPHEGPTGSSPKPPAPVRKSRGGRWAWVAVGVVGVLAAVAAGVIIVITNKDGTQTRIEVPDGATIATESTDKSSPARPTAVAPTPANPDLEPDRTAAERAFALGGGVRVTGSNREVRKEADLPKGKFTLAALDLDGTAVTDRELAAFAGCKGLTHLDLYNTGVTDGGLEYFKDRPGLTHLLLSGTKVTDAGLGHFKGCKNLRELHLFDTAVTDAGMKHFTECRAITCLHLGKTKVTDDGLECFKGCKGMKELHLYNIPITDAGLGHFAGCKDLTFLGLNYTRVTDAGLQPFGKCERLQSLYLYGTGVKDPGLLAFAGCKGLKFVEARQTKITAKGVDQFHAAVPGCKIDHDGGTVPPKK